MLAGTARLVIMTQSISSLGGLARAKALSGQDRSRIAKRAAKARWSARGKGILSRQEIRKQIEQAVAGQEASVYLFGSYAKKTATAKSDVDLMIVLAHDADWFKEAAALRQKLDFGKPVDLLVVDRATYDHWKLEEGSVQYEVEKTGVRLV